MISVATDQSARLWRHRVSQAHEVRSINGHVALFNWHYKKHSPMSAQCGWCGDVRRGLLWENVQPLSKREHTTHGICPECALTSFGWKSHEKNN